MTNTRDRVLNELMNMEYVAQYHYMQAAAWAASHNLDGCCNFLLKHAMEEHSHVIRIFKHLTDLGVEAKFSSIEAPVISANDVEGLFSLMYEHENKVTIAYDDAIETILAEKDHQTFHFLQWFVKEQHEEMALFRRILDKIRLIGSGPHSRYMFDLEIEKIANKS
ncbi:MAG: ferritin [Candidatus Liberibacter asiaticus]|uniref:ferritin n=1 Tax=Liberibacter asiaticus TaxID=34021 RepID=UPI0004E066F2|nr:ferritin [Candidatus Liberibacter asiaticus]MDI1493850.1 ferritin [Candidatus Liberibacter asiaticus]QYK84424.1 ferritin [Candidatus Liberibacter asiaticus]WCM58871.1 ferritin [Candidatus Liberibacter asiaticus]BAP26365.1 ferroxidase [Candidatus Liberibacter asiaticus str. Ishi-1]